MTHDIHIIAGDFHSVDRIMPVMQNAFDPAFGEAWTAEQCRGLLCLPGTMLRLAVKDSTLLGFVLARYVLDEAELLLIATDTGQRRQGIGKLLVKSVVNWCQANSVQKVILEVRSGNGALELYTKLGFTQIGKRQNYYRGLDNSHFDALTLQLNL